MSSFESIGGSVGDSASSCNSNCHDLHLPDKFKFEDFGIATGTDFYFLYDCSLKLVN